MRTVCSRDAASDGPDLATIYPSLTAPRLTIVARALGDNHVSTRSPGSASTALRGFCRSGLVYLRPSSSARPVQIRPGT